MQGQIAQAEAKVDQAGRNVAAATQAMTKAVAAAEEVSSVHVSVWFGLIRRFGLVRFYVFRVCFLPCFFGGFALVLVLFYSVFCACFVF